jgi:hypothetical protein
VTEIREGEMANVEPTAADRAAATAYWRASLDDPAVAGGVTEGFLAGILHERERAARVALGKRQPAAPGLADYTEGYNDACDEVAAGVLQGPQS